MQDAYDQFFSIFKWLMLTGLAGFVARIAILALAGDRLSGGRAPSLANGDRTTFFQRLIALIGMNGTPRRTLDTYRLPASAGLRLLVWCVFVVAFCYVATMAETARMSPMGNAMATLLVIGTFYIALHTTLYEVSFDRETVTLPTWWFTRRSYRWPDLDAVIERDNWMMTFVFSRGQRVAVHKFIVGYPLLMDAARKAMREV